jgi:hypothetical protein
MGWLGLSYVTFLSLRGFSIDVQSHPPSILLSCFAMWDYNRINKNRDAYCAREGIDASRRAEFRDLGSDSPLFRYVAAISLPVSLTLTSRGPYSYTI